MCEDLLQDMRRPSLDNLGSEWTLLGGRRPDRSRHSVGEPESDRRAHGHKHGREKYNTVRAKW